MKDKPKSDYLDILQVFIGIAALMVVCHHTLRSIVFYHHIESPFFNCIGSIGKYGVDFFFVLSGFIISYTAYHKYNHPNAFREYVKNRLIRIYIPYLPIGIAMLLLYNFFPSFSNSERDISVLTSLTLIPHGNPALSVAWTLSFELCFYMLFSISFFSRKGWNYFIIAWLLSVLLFNYTSLKSLEVVKNPFLKLVFSAYNIEFILGYWLALIIVGRKRISMKLVVIVLLLSVSGFLYSILIKQELIYFSANLLFAIAMFMLIYLGIVYYSKKIKPTAILMLIGNATYSIYLLHNPLQMLLIRMYPKINSVIGLTFALIFVLGITSLIGYLYYIVFEKKAMQKIKAIV